MTRASNPPPSDQVAPQRDAAVAVGLRWPGSIFQVDVAGRAGRTSILYTTPQTSVTHRAVVDQRGRLAYLLPEEPPSGTAKASLRFLTFVLLMASAEEALRAEVMMVHQPILRLGMHEPPRRSPAARSPDVPDMSGASDRVAREFSDDFMAVLLNLHVGPRESGTHTPALLDQAAAYGSWLYGRDDIQRDLCVTIRLHLVPPHRGAQHQPALGRGKSVRAGTSSGPRAAGRPPARHARRRIPAFRPGRTRSSSGASVCGMSRCPPSSAD
jgi:hypothetical protein